MQENQKCAIVTEDGEEYEISTSMVKLAKRLGPNFFQSHKSCIINLDKVRKINYTDNIITFHNEEEIYLISNRRKKPLRDYVSNYK